MLQGLQRFTDVRWGSQVPRHATRSTEHARTSDDWENACFLTCTRVSASMFLKGTSQWPEHALVSAQILGGNCNLDRYWLVFQLARFWDASNSPVWSNLSSCKTHPQYKTSEHRIQPLCICEKIHHLVPLEATTASLPTLSLSKNAGHVAQIVWPFEDATIIWPSPFL